MIASLLMWFMAAVVFVVSYIYWKSEHSSFARTIDLIPGPPKIPFVGTIQELKGKTDLLKIFQEEWVEKYGRIYRVWLGLKPMVLISSAKYIEKILSTSTHINKAEAVNNFFGPWLGNGILIARGEAWKKARRLLTPTFHFNILNTYTDVYNRNADILAQQWNKIFKTSNACETDVMPFLKRCTLDIICETAMGVGVNAQMDHDSKYIKAVEGVTDAISERFFTVWNFLPNWMYFQISSAGRECKENLSIIHDFTKKVIRDRKLEMSQEESAEEVVDDDSFGMKKKRSFLDLLLTAAKEDADLSDTQIRNEVDTFMFGGHDTTSMTITMFLYCMATHPNYQKLVQEELEDVFGDGEQGCTMNDAAQLKYMECCIKETLRLFPPAPNFARQMTEDTQLGDYKIPAGTTVTLQLVAHHRNQEFFPDPHTFNPDRFHVDQSAGRHPYAFIPFSAGPRNCVGQKFAMLEMKVILASLLRKFNFDYNADRKPVQMVNKLVLKPAGGMHLIITPKSAVKLSRSG